MDRSRNISRIASISALLVGPVAVTLKSTIPQKIVFAISEPGLVSVWRGIIEFQIIK